MGPHLKSILKHKRAYFSSENQVCTEKGYLNKRIGNYSTTILKISFFMGKDGNFQKVYAKGLYSSES